MRYFFVIFGFFGFLMGMDIQGIITSVDSPKKIIVVNNNVQIKVLPQTVIKLDDCGMFGNDVYGRFTDLKVNSFVDVDVFVTGDQMNMMQSNQMNNFVYVAEEIELQCNKYRAY